MAQSLHVTTPDGGYEIVIERGILQTIAAQAEKFGLNTRTAVVTNTTLAPLYGQSFAAALPDARLITIPDGEPYKTLETVASLYSAFIVAGLDRASTVMALGGGVVGDTAGFAAATYLRGVRLVQIPTSLLAMVDSSVGGKVGVDLREGKNLVGAFKQPDRVFIDPDVLSTLPERQRRCGMAEVIKHGLLADEPLLHRIDDDAELIRRAVQVKIDVVQADPYEKGARAHLNLGHTFGHAIEQVSGYAWLHGEAVAVGLIAAARLSYRLGLCDAALVDTVESVIERHGLPTQIGDLDPERLWATMATDKKWIGGAARFVLLKAVGQPQIVHNVKKDDAIAVLKTLQGENA